MFILHLILSLLFIHVLSDSYGPQYPYSLIMGHKFVSSIFDIPHHVLVVYSNLYCSGSLIRSKIVLTSATCLTAGPNEKIYVKVGTNSVTGLGQVIPVIDVKMHEYFRYYSKIDNDIAMLFLKENVVFGDNVKKILLVEPETAIKPGLVIEVSGWGSQSLPQKYAYLLLTTQMVILEREDCVDIHKNLITPSNFCAKFEPGHRLSDIGGSATYKQQLAGIMSYGTSNEHGPYSAVFTNITYFNKWIMLNTKRFMEKYCVSEKENSQNSSKSSDEEFYGEWKIGLVYRGLFTTLAH